MSRYAVVQVGTHQYRVEENTVFEVERFRRPEQKEFKLDQVLFVQNSSHAKVGEPYVRGAGVVCEVVNEFNQPKVISFKFKRRKGYRKKRGHRQTMVRLRVKSIEPG